MQIDVKTILFEGALHRLRELSDANHLIVQNEQSLVAVAWPELQKTRDGLTVVLGPQGLGKVVATKVSVDNAWIVEPKSQRVLMAREGEIEFVDPSGRDKLQRVTVAGLPSGSFAAALDSAGQHLLLVVMRAVNMDFAEYGIVVITLSDGQLQRELTIRSNADLELHWDETFRTWVICDTSNATVWRWDGAKLSTKLASALTDTVYSATLVVGDDGAIVTALVTQGAGATGLISGRAEQDRVDWRESVTLHGPSVLVTRRHPKLAVWACLAQEGKVQQIQIRDAAGKVLGEANIRPPAHVSDLLWSASTPERVWAFGVHSLAAATLNQ